jgi:hypothetical protein
MVNFGFSDNSYIKNNFNTNTANSLEDLIVAVRVLNIILDETHPRFNELGGWNALGTIEYELVTSPFSRPISDAQVIPTASPLNPNIKNYPLVNEIIYLISLPNTEIGKTNVSQKQYYINIVSLWNHPHHNAYPINPNNPLPAQQKDYIQTINGSVRQVTDQSTEIFLGKTFKERPNIHPLLPFEGDIIQEGRWGNSIRLGSTVSGTPNEWSTTGDNGDPITIIRNGQGAQTEQGWIPITENIKNNNTSIYLTSTQNIPIAVSSDSYVSYESSPPTNPSKYNGAQVILDSGRLVFNSYNDNILFSSANSINLNSQKSVNIDTKKFIVQADKIYLGIESLAKEPLLLGNTTVELIRNLLTALSQLADVLKTAQTSPTIPSTPANLTSINLAAVFLSSKLETLNKQLDTLTSKRNFTL